MMVIIDNYTFLRCFLAHVSQLRLSGHLSGHVSNSLVDCAKA